jgi:hypothetical protein
MENKLFFFIFLILLLKIEFSVEIKIKHKAAPKKIFVEVMPADDPEDAMNNLRTAEDVNIV